MPDTSQIDVATCCTAYAYSVNGTSSSDAWQKAWKDCNANPTDSKYGCQNAQPNNPPSSSGSTSGTLFNCPDFTLTDPLPSISCFIRTTVAYSLVNVAAVIVLIFGLYLLFRPEINRAVVQVQETGKQVAAHTAEVAAVA